MVQIGRQASDSNHTPRGEGGFGGARGAGGTAGALLGAIVTGVYAEIQGLPAVVPAEALAGGVVVAALAIGAVAGLYPSVRAARLSPTEALRTV